MTGDSKQLTVDTITLTLWLWQQLHLFLSGSASPVTCSKTCHATPPVTCHMFKTCHATPPVTCQVLKNLSCNTTCHLSSVENLSCNVTCYTPHHLSNCRRVALEGMQDCQRELAAIIGESCQAQQSLRTWAEHE